VHTSVLLKVKTEATNTLQLSWTKYKGWNVQEYAIYKAAGGNFEFLNKVSGNDTTYSDKGLCDQTYTYYIVAINASGNYASLSNTASGKPDYFYSNTSEDVRFATVTDDNKINLKWQKSDDNDNPKAYIIDRFESGKGWTNNYASVSELQFTDTKVNVNEKSYAYRIRIEDNCGNMTTAGEIGKTILLTAEGSDEKVQLKWSAYGRWKNGIRQYRVEILNAQQQWQLVTSVSGNDTSYMDANDHSNIKGGLVYRVVAKENANTDAVSSTSNKAEVFLTSHLYVPNAFTPDADGINDVFKAEGKFINEDAGSEDHNFKLCIFNRWGEKIFETNDISKGWDGKFKGTDVQQDTYVYTITAFGYDKQSYYLQGNFTLLR
jgi:gliding motility-associated-like protein